MHYQYSSGSYEKGKSPYPIYKSSIAVDPRYEDRIPGLQWLTLETLEGEQDALKRLRKKAQSIDSKR